MSVTVKMSDQELAKLEQFTQRDNDPDAIIVAEREFLRLETLRELKAASGKVEFELNWEHLEELELKESCPPAQWISDYGPLGVCRYMRLGLVLQQAQFAGESRR